jgi:hypothetical protein
MTPIGSMPSCRFERLDEFAQWRCWRRTQPSLRAAFPSFSSALVARPCATARPASAAVTASSAPCEIRNNPSCSPGSSYVAAATRSSVRAPTTACYPAACSHDMLVRSTSATPRDRPSLRHLPRGGRLADPVWRAWRARPRSASPHGRSGQRQCSG